jgi:tRNA 2-thiouridine synthesizing protein D
VKFSVVVYVPPYSNEGAASALKFSRAVIAKGHSIYRIFFFSDGVHNANSLAITPQDEINLQAEWHDLIDEQDIDSVVCVTSGLKRGLIDSKESEKRNLASSSMMSSSELSGLGQLIDAYANSDRVLSFG